MNYLLIATDPDLGPIPFNFTNEQRARDFAISHRAKLPHLTFSLFMFNGAAFLPVSL